MMSKMRRRANACGLETKQVTAMDPPTYTSVHSLAIHVVGPLRWTANDCCGFTCCHHF